MFEIIAKETLAPRIKKLTFGAPYIAKKAQPGQFVVLRVGEKGERIPLTIFDKDSLRGTITVIFQEVGKTTYQLGRLEVGEKIQDLTGPLGCPTKVREVEHLLGIAGGVGAAVLYPVVELFKENRTKISIILGARKAELLILESEFKKIASQIYITTDDGSQGRKGTVVQELKELLLTQKDYDLVIAVGPVAMMEAVCQVTQPYSLETIVSLNPIMVDGTGMCGACRVTIGGKTKFTCVDGPEFPGHQVNWSELAARQRMFVEEERLLLNASGILK
jgi:ferredoxin--NADP+ reductase